MKAQLAIICSLPLILLPPPSHSESLRCGTKLIHIGETKAEVVEKCGEPLAMDSYCEPIAINSCVDVDIWTYNPGSGKFMTNLYFSQGHLQAIRYGNRAK